MTTGVTPMAKPTAILCSACGVRPAVVTPKGRPPLCVPCIPAAVVAAHGLNTAAAVAEFLGVVRRAAMGGRRDD